MLADEEESIYATQSRWHMKLGIPRPCARYAHGRDNQYREGWQNNIGGAPGLMPPHHKIGVELFTGVGVTKRGAFQGFHPSARFEHYRMSGAGVP